MTQGTSQVAFADAGRPAEQQDEATGNPSTEDKAQDQQIWFFLDYQIIGGLRTAFSISPSNG